MAVVWTICGAGRGVGKTYLAQALCAVLPNSVYAKQGASTRKAGKPENYFTSPCELESFVRRHLGDYEHIVVESNAWAREGRGDIVIYLGGNGPNPRPDSDEIAEKAHIRICDSDTSADCSKVLNGWIQDQALLETIVGVVENQRQFCQRPVISVRSKVWFVAGDEHIFGFGLARLLENIDSAGSLAEAARSVDMSYRHAWDIIKAAEKHLGTDLIVRESGGQGGGRSMLSPEGRHLLDVFGRVNAEVSTYADSRFRAHFFGEAHHE